MKAKKCDSQPSIRYSVIIVIVAEHHCDAVQQLEACQRNDNAAVGLAR